MRTALFRRVACAALDGRVFFCERCVCVFFFFGLPHASRVAKSDLKAGCVLADNALADDALEDDALADGALADSALADNALADDALADGALTVDAPSSDAAVFGRKSSC